jgi:hypothetical protein
MKTIFITVVREDCGDYMDNINVYVGDSLQAAHATAYDKREVTSNDGLDGGMYTSLAFDYFIETWINNQKVAHSWFKY